MQGQAEPRGLRGGSWNNNSNNIRVANRNNNNPTNQNNNIGFRCAVAPGLFLEGQVRSAGDTANARCRRERRLQACSWLGAWCAQPKINAPALCGRSTDSTPRAGVRQKYGRQVCAM